jgi:hypothetical protein
MLETNNPTRFKRGLVTRQAGVAAVEFAVVSVVFFMLVFGVLEVARAMYVLNTLQEVTRRAASAAVNTNFRDADDLMTVRENAIFRNSTGYLILAEPIADGHIRIDYLSVARAADGSLTMQPIPQASLPASPASNKLLCLSDPNDAGCIRFVRVRVCEPGDAGTCNAVGYKSIFPFINLPFNLPTALTIARAESLGFIPGSMPGS